MNTAPSHPKISVVVPFYNAGRYLAHCLDGLLVQSFPREDYELILVDNNSTDDSAAIAARYSGLSLLRQPVTGSYAARNLGIRAARAPIIATLDPDCRPGPEWLSQIDAAMRDPACLVLLGHRGHANSSVSMELLEMYEAEKVSYVMTRGDKDLFFGYTNNMAFRRTLFDAIGLFPERVRGGDTVFVRRVVDRFGCRAVQFIPEMQVTHLELDTVGAYYSKRLIYGRSNELISQVMAFKHLRGSDRWAVFMEVGRKHRLSLRKSLLLLLLLAPGVLLYHGGRLLGMLRRA